jgi:hypothetical protein
VKLMQDGVPVRDAGREAGISQATAYRWRKEIRVVDAAAARREDENRRTGLRGTMRQALADYEAAQEAAARLQAEKIEQVSATVATAPAASLATAATGENEKRPPAAVTSPAAGTSQSDENENAAAVPAAPKLNRHMRRKLARLERRAGRGLAPSGAQPDRLAA